MNAFNFSSRIRIRGRRPRWSQAVVMLLAVVGLLVAVINLGERADNQAVASTGPTRPNLTPGTPNRGISFRDRLIAGLKARRGSEIEFIDRVVLEVRLGHLPERLVNQTFFWSRDRVNRIGRSQRPIIYFQPVLTAQARRLGVTL